MRAAPPSSSTATRSARRRSPPRSSWTRGGHSVSFKKPGFEPLERSVQVAGGETASVEAKLEPEITTAEIVVREKASKPVTVFVDGKEVGPAPWRGRLPFGKHEVRVAADALASKPRAIELRKGEVADVELEAAATQGRLEIATSDDHGVIRIDRAVVGEGRYAGDLSSGDHVVQISREGFRPFEQTVAIAPGKTASLRVVLEREPSAARADEANDGEGIYGAFRLAGQLQLSDAGNQLQTGCDAVTPPDATAPNATPNTCSSGSPRGGGLLGVLGYAWKYLGIELLFGSTADVTSASARTGTDTDWHRYTYDIVRVGGIASLRARGTLESKMFRASLAAGPGIAERVGISGKSADYFSPALSVDATLGVRLGAKTALTLGCMLWVEHAGSSGPSISLPEAPSFRLFSGTQTMVLPHFGFEFGP